MQKNQKLYFTYFRHKIMMLYILVREKILCYLHNLKFNATNSGPVFPDQISYPDTIFCQQYQGIRFGKRYRGGGFIFTLFLLFSFRNRAHILSPGSLMKSSPSTTQLQLLSPVFARQKILCRVLCTPRPHWSTTCLSKQTACLLTRKNAWECASPFPAPHVLSDTFELISTAKQLF